MIRNLIRITIALVCPTFAWSTPITFQGSTSGLFSDPLNLIFTGNDFGPTTTDLSGNASLLLGSFVLSRPDSGHDHYGGTTFTLTVNFTVPDGSSQIFTATLSGNVTSSNSGRSGLR